MAGGEGGGVSGSMATAHAGAGAQEGVGKAGKGAKGGKGWNSEGRKLGRAPDQAVLKRRGVLPYHVSLPAANVGALVCTVVR